MKQYSEFCLGDMLLTYSLDEQNRMSMSLIPAALKDQAADKAYNPEPLVQIHARGDRLTSGYGNGHTLACTPAADALKFISQKQEGNTVVTAAADAVTDWPY